MGARKVAAALLVSAAAIAVTAAGASASPGTGVASTPFGATPALKLGASNLVKSTSIRFEAVYDAVGYYGAVRCVGHHQTNEKKKYPGTETEGGRDVERCVSTTGKPLEGLAPGETVALGGWFPGSSGWSSDYDGQGASSLEYTVSASARSFRLVAYYPFAG